MEFDLDEIIEALREGLQDSAQQSFADMCAAECAIANREVFVGTIGPGLGDNIDMYIRYWNMKDEEAGIPVEERQPIKVYIDSNGRCLDDTLTMIDAISMSKTPVWTICTGNAYSGGFFTFIAGHKRIAYPMSSFMFHEGSTNSGTVDAGKFRNYADFYSRQMELLKKVTLKYTKISEEDYEHHRKDDWWFFAEEGIQYGFVDEIAKELI